MTAVADEHHPPHWSQMFLHFAQGFSREVIRGALARMAMRALPWIPDL